MKKYNLPGKFNNIQEIELDGIDHKDHPDYVDAFITYAEFEDGTELTSEELDELNDEHRDFVYELVFESLH